MPLSAEVILKGMQTAETRISLLERDLLNVNSSVQELKTLVNTHKDRSLVINEKINERIEDLKDEFKRELAVIKLQFTDDLRKMKEHFDSQMSTQNVTLAKIHDKLSDLDKWRWIVFGAIAIVGFIVSKATNILGSFTH